MKFYRLFLLLPILALVGCGGGKADTETPVAELEQKAETMSVEDLKAEAAAYKDAIAAKMQDLEPLRDKLSEIPLVDQMGEEAKALQADIAEVTGDLDALKVRLQVYLDALKEKGESIQEYLN